MYSAHTEVYIGTLDGYSKWDSKKKGEAGKESDFPDQRKYAAWRRVFRTFLDEWGKIQLKHQDANEANRGAALRELLSDSKHGKYLSALDEVGHSQHTCTHHSHTRTMASSI